MSNTHKNDPYNLIRLPLEMWEIDRVKPYERNNKIHTTQHIAKLKASIQADGLFDPIIVDFDGVIIAGHGRYAALVELGHKVVPVRYAAHLTKNQADAARIAHNKTSSNDYDSAALADEMRRLMDADDVDITVLGLDEHELDFLVEDLGDMNLSAISKNLDQDIDDQDEETKQKVSATDTSSEKLVKAMGFSVIPIASVRDVRKFIAEIEKKTGKSGADAFVEYCRDF